LVALGARQERIIKDLATHIFGIVERSGTILVLLIWNVERRVASPASTKRGTPSNRLVRALLHIPHHRAIHPKIDQPAIGRNVRAGDEACGIAG
jgi:hypothetical protein